MIRKTIKKNAEKVIKKVEENDNVPKSFFENVPESENSLLDEEFDKKTTKKTAKKTAKEITEDDNIPDDFFNDVPESADSLLGGTSVVEEAIEKTKTPKKKCF